MHEVILGLFAIKPLEVLTLVSFHPTAHSHQLFTRRKKISVSVTTARVQRCHFPAIISTGTPVDKHFVEASLNSLLMLVLRGQNVVTSVRGTN